MEAQGVIVTTKGMSIIPALGGGGYTLVNVKHSNAMPECLIICIRYRRLWGPSKFGILEVGRPKEVENPKSPHSKTSIV